MASSLVVVGLAVIGAVHVRRIARNASELRENLKRREQRARTYSCGGVEWPLTENFWGIVLRTSAEDLRVNASLLNGAIGDPLCGNASCRREVWPYVGRGRCLDCSETFRLGLAEMDSVPEETKLHLKNSVYREARAEYFRRHGVSKS